MSDNPHPSPSAVQASLAIRATVSRLRRRILNASAVDDLTLGQTSVLARLSGEGGITASELASAEGVRHQSMTATVVGLAARGLVARRPDPADGRRQLIELTVDGRRRLEEGRKVRTEWLAERLQDRCTEEERQAVIAALAVLERLTHD
ncbi:MarR family winged helix-turn-helix transcriptional regulator [Streptomyces sp. NPDC060198]|uniref:MarR family winged helix-turn-helix transcriptional regulator n=1 Tax=Streptomyces sp. NPDC060198 TaxID=3347070 RepID=UPI00364ADFB6